ncbi:MAG: beta-N-acetylhexosaminidase, partial [Treponema sp.]|nr:beta-N-acetylhexosaminidase [Treponema sp.]
MTLKQKIGQRFAFGFSGAAPNGEFRRLVREYQIGNVILFRENLKSATQARALCGELQDLIRAETGQPAFIALDQEGGAVTRLPADMVNAPGAMALAAPGDPEKAAAAARISAAELGRIGVNLNLAPVLDINSNWNNPVIGNRSFAQDSQGAVPFIKAVVGAYEDAGLLCCGKHFPGHGDTAVDSHLDLPLVDKGLGELEAGELLPFQAAIGADIPAIMTSHILFPRLEEEKLPATLSRKILQGLLREKMGFKGLILSDGMEMKAVKDYYGVPQASVLALAAGVDILFICHESTDMEESLRKVSAAYEDGRLDTAALDASAERILRYKERYAFFGMGGRDETLEALTVRREENAALMRCTLAPWKAGAMPPPLGDRPFFTGSLPYLSTIASSKPDESLSFARWFAAEFGGSFLETPVNPDAGDIARTLAALPPASSITLGTYNGHLNRGQIALAQTLGEEAKHRGIPFAVLALRNPWDLALLPENAWGLALWEYSPESFRAAAAVFRGEY